MPRVVPEEQRQAAFELYYSLGDERTQKAVAKELKVNPNTIGKWAKKYDWQGQVERRDMQAVLKLDEVAIEKDVEARQRHIRIAQKIQTKALMELERARIKGAAEAINALTKAITIERQARGMTGEDSGKVGNTHNTQINNYFSEAEMNKLLDDELIKCGVEVTDGEKFDNTGQDQDAAEGQEGEVPADVGDGQGPESEEGTLESPGEPDILGVRPHERPSPHPPLPEVPRSAGVSGTGEPDALAPETPDREKPPDDGN